MKRRGLLTLLALGGCSAPVVRETMIADPRHLAPPQRLALLDFAVTPDEVQLDRGVAAQLQQTLDARPLTAQQLEVARNVGRRVADATAAELSTRGFAVERMARPPAAANATTLLVEGQLLFADQGNTTRQRLIGFGAGRSSVGIDAQLYHAAGALPPRALEDFEITVESPRTPGMGVGVGAGAAAGRMVDAAIIGGGVQGLSGTQRANVAAEADSVGRELGGRISTYLDRRGWRIAT